MYPSLSAGAPAGGAPLHTTFISAGGGNSNGPSTPTGATNDARVPLTSIENIPSSGQFQFEFEFEHSVVRKGTSGKQEDSMEQQLGELAGSGRVEDPAVAAIDRYRQMGFDKEAAAMAVGMYGFELAAQDKVTDFCNHYLRLKEMGFSPQSIAGALVMNRNDVQAATDTLMS